jgi:predicted GNAT family N-acyltransferase
MATLNTIKISDESDMQTAFKIREEVFVVEQNVPKEDEYDEFEISSTHFLAYCDGQPCGTARWRYTDKGIKLERFAVREGFRSSGVGSSLVQAVLADIASKPEAAGKKLYLHAQLTAVPLYEKFHFHKEGDIFDECGIMHYKMTK